MSAKLFEIAISYRNAGLDVIPDHPTEKYPIGIPNWEKKIFSDSELNEYICQKEWSIGLRNQEGLDFDNHGNPKAEVTLENWKVLVDVIYPGLIEKLLVEKTQHEGFHVAWKCKVVEGNQKLASRPPTEDELKRDPKCRAVTFIETRGQGGQFVVSPSPGYSLIQGDWCNLPQITPEERKVLIQAAKSLDQIPASTEDFRASAKSPGKERPGDIFNREGIGEALGLLKQEGWDVVCERENTTFLRRPGKSEGISATYGYVAPGIFYNFSSNGAPFEPGKAYTPFAIFSILKFGGNFSLAASELAQRYGMNPDKPHTDDPKIPWPRPMAEEAFIGLTGEVVKTIEPHSESDCVALLINFLTGFGSVIGDQAHFRVEADKHPMRLFSVLVGESSRGRKGTSWGYIKQLLTTTDPEWEKRVIGGGLSSGEGLIWAVRDQITKRSPIKKNGHIAGYEEIIDDPGIADKRLLIVESELASTLRVLGREGNILSALIRNAWDSGNLQTLTKNSPARATGAHIAIIGHITKEELLRYLTSTETSNGFGNRFMWFCVKRSKILPFGSGGFDQQPLVDKLSPIVNFAKGTSQLTWGEETKTLWGRIYVDLTEEESGLIGSLTARAEPYVTRLACIYALLDRSTIIKIRHLKAAVAVWDYARASTEFIFQGRSGDPVGNKIIEALSGRPGGMTRTGIYVYFGKNTSSEQISISLENLEKIGRVKKEYITPESRSKALYTLNTLNTYRYSGKNYLKKLNQYIKEEGLDTNNSGEDYVNNVLNVFSGNDPSPTTLTPKKLVCPICGGIDLAARETSGGAIVKICAFCPVPDHLLTETERKEIPI